ncbi:SUKH-3 domain-containing protein [Streptomyces sp. NPDC048481]|uniref:SUKH-3 domain-containing protein n=1 Tax=Streptomyces sp. NPDC048481 TaxID=3365557 RepID=UPI00371D42D5
MSAIDFASLHPDALTALRQAGWSPDRKVSTAQWLEPLQSEGFRAHPLAGEILASLGGLTVEPGNRVGPNFTNEDPLTFDPLEAGAGQRGTAEEVEGILGGSYFPIGEWLSYSSVFVEAGGRVIATGMGWIWELGATVEAALELAICANRPLICLYSDPGLDPWPAMPTG